MYRPKLLSLQNPKTRDLYRLHEKFDSIKKLDAVMVLLIMATLVFFEASADNDQDRATRVSVIIVLFLTEIPFGVIGSQAVSRADQYRTYLFWAISVFLPLIVVTFGTEAASDSAHFNELKENSNGEVDVGRYATMLVIGSVSILVRAVTVIFSVLLYFQYESPQYRPMLKLVREGVFKYKRYLKTRRTGANAGDDIGGKMLELNNQTSSKRDVRASTASSERESFYEDVERFRDMENTMRAPSFVVSPSRASVAEDVVENPIRSLSNSSGKLGRDSLDQASPSRASRASRANGPNAFSTENEGVGRPTSTHSTEGGRQSTKPKRPRYDVRGKVKNFESVAAELDD